VRSMYLAWNRLLCTCIGVRKMLGKHGDSRPEPEARSGNDQSRGERGVSEHLVSRSGAKGRGGGLAHLPRVRQNGAILQLTRTR
jgi:hypothetical protein